MNKRCTSSRRTFLGCAAAAYAAAMVPRPFLAAAEQAAAAAAPLPFPVVDFHVHLDHSSIEQVLPLAEQRHVKFGIVEHAGTTENQYPTLLSNDEQLKAYLKNLDGKGVYRGVQAEWTDWMKCFSREALAQLDYVLTDAMTFPGKTGQRVKLWDKSAEDLIDMSNHDAFMDRFVDWHVQVMATEPLDIMANTSWLPKALMGDYDTLWTEKRVQKVIDAALKYGVALEISASYQLPKLAFLKQAKAAGVKFSFGSNGRYPKMGILDYSIEMARQLDLKASDMFTPAPDGQKAVQRRQW